ncbi:DUF1351 domain-containing protein [Cyanothece sp. BG0011]|uniref:DUF1351 domain-containing protein n=1 Tax=Cyanothece sp. BG0011 TaxID=2082950 RepID=UPI000D1F37E1|nr:DUF1351 domain-containing protein [Cyanothece sp. BG0011]
MSDPSTVTYTTAEILKRIEDKIDSNHKEIRQEIKEINQKIDSNYKEVNDKIDSNHKEIKEEIKEFQKDVDKRLNNLEVGQGTLTEKVESIDKRLQNVEGTQKNQIWALIVIVAGAIITSGAKLFFTANP